MSEQEIALIGAAALVALVALKIGWMMRKARAQPDAGADAAQPEAGCVAPAPAAADGSSDARLALAAIPAISEQQAAALVTAGIDSIAALGKHGHSDEQLHALADALGLEDFVLARWTGCADLLQVDGISPALADALVRTGVRSRRALAEANPDRVQNKLAAAAARSEPAGPAPDRATIAALIDAAARTGSPD